MDEGINLKMNAGKRAVMVAAVILLVLSLGFATYGSAMPVLQATGIVQVNDTNVEPANATDATASTAFSMMHNGLELGEGGTAVLSLGDNVTWTSVATGFSGLGSLAEATLFADAQLDLFGSNTGYDYQVLIGYEWRIFASVRNELGEDDFAFAEASVDGLDNLGIVDIFDSAAADSDLGPPLDVLLSGSGIWSFLLRADGSTDNQILTFLDVTGIADSNAYFLATSQLSITVDGMERQVAPIPEPNTLTLLAFGLLGLATSLRRLHNRKITSSLSPIQ